MILVKRKSDVSVADLWELVSDECFCTYIDENDQEQKSSQCSGDCGDSLVEDFLELCTPYFRPGRRDTYWPRWDGLQPVSFMLTEVRDILRVLPPRSGWYVMKYRLVKEPGRGNKRVWIAVWLKHHDGSRLFFF
jgi:hypothetical protein